MWWTGNGHLEHLLWLPWDLSDCHSGRKCQHQSTRQHVNGKQSGKAIFSFCLVFCIICVPPTYICVPGNAFGLQSSGSLSGFTAWWVFPPYNRCTSLSLSRSGSAQSGSQWDQWSARSHTVRHSHFTCSQCGHVVFFQYYWRVHSFP